MKKTIEFNRDELREILATAVAESVLDYEIKPDQITSIKATVAEGEVYSLAVDVSQEEEAIRL